MSYQTGINAAIEAINTKQPMNALLNAAIQVGTTPTGAAMLGGLCGVMADIFDKMQAIGYQFPMATERGQQIANATPHARRLYVTALLQRLDQSTGDTLADMANAVYAIRNSLKNASVDAPATPEPQRVEIVAMPDRSTITQVERDSHDEIISTTQVERDL